MGYKLNYTFLGQKNETSQGNYTPLIIPKMPFSKSDPNFTAQEGQQIPASRIGVDEITQIIIETPTKLVRWTTASISPIPVA